MNVMVQSGMGKDASPRQEQVGRRVHCHQTKTVGQDFLQTAAEKWNKLLFLLSPLGFVTAAWDGNTIILEGNFGN